MKKNTLSPWSSQQLIAMSRSLAEAYGTPLGKSSSSRSKDQSLSQQLLTLSAAKSSSLYW